MNGTAAARRHITETQGIGMQALNCSPMIRFFLIIQVSHARDMRCVAEAFRPVDRFMLGFESAEHMVNVVLDNKVLDGTAARAAFGARFYVYVCHGRLSPRSLAN
jgi:hypothetical protein